MASCSSSLKCQPNHVLPESSADRAIGTCRPFAFMQLEHSSLHGAGRRDTVGVVSPFLMVWLYRPGRHLLLLQRSMLLCPSSQQQTHSKRLSWMNFAPCLISRALATSSQDATRSPFQKGPAFHRVPCTNQSHCGAFSSLGEKTRYQDTDKST